MPFASRPSLESEAPCAQPRHAVDHGVSPHNGIQWLGDGGGLTFHPGMVVLETGATFDGGLLGVKIDCIDVHI